MALILHQQYTDPMVLRSYIQDLEERIKERDEALRKESEWTFQQTERIWEIGRKIEKRQRRDHKIERKLQRQERALLQEELNEALQKCQKKGRALKRARRREQLAQEREKILQQERDNALQQAQKREKVFQQEKDNALQQAQERERALQQEINRALQERDRALKRLQEIDPLLQPLTLGDFIMESHASLFSKLTIDPNAARGSDAAMTNLSGKWQPRKVMEWTWFLSEQRLIFDNVCEVFPSDLRAFPPQMTVREDRNKITPITDEKSLVRFVSNSIDEPVKNIMKELNTVDKLGRVCRGDIRVNFIDHPEHAKPLKTKTKSSHPEEPVFTKFCIRRDPAVGMASSTMLSMWEPKAPYDLTVQHLRAALRPTTTFGEVTEETESPPVETEDAEEISQSTATATVTAEMRVNRAVTETYHNMMENCLEFGILTTGQAIVFLHVNWDDPQTLYLSSNWGAKWNFLFD
ncbi:hypothetical protein E4U13_004039 [Claviceps humidiphila]|uniref:Uncharacterized protein n=1 Tax=Claviceps humidiphila TaxID=1294629 RepID=A0A9P7PZF2_9HYPO|nr:hypothetical protein E4U13_004039 [Claviceps humidiphila]